jgi:phosphoribosyl-ATP pyrophosphohydrolase/phosphoribosyl-AMP cyclohydrolase
MLGWMDREALAATLATGDVHFHSRSRGVLWRKGETSGNVLRLVSLAADCDGDALLVRARPAGPTCHTGEASCFHRGMHETGDPGQSTDEAREGRRRRRPGRRAGEGARAPEIREGASAPGGRGGGDASVPQAARAGEALDLAPLFAVLRDRAARRPDGSYTVKLLENEDKALKKLIEEAGEVALAVKNRDRANLVWEVADVLYHLAVIMTAQGVAPAEINAELERRAGAPR